MELKTIALASANEAALIAASEQLLEVAATRGVRLNLLQGVQSAAEAQAVYREGGELWALGHIDGAFPELVPLVDRTIPGSSHEQISVGVLRAFKAFTGKTRIAS